jgi:hypothetical protein
VPRPRDISWGFGTSATWDQFLRSDNEEHRKRESFGALQISFVEKGFEASQGLAVSCRATAPRRLFIGPPKSVKLGNVFLSAGCCCGLIHAMRRGFFATVTVFSVFGPGACPGQRIQTAIFS